MKARPILKCAAVAVVLCPLAAGGALFTVTNSADAGAGSLRQAVADANANAGPDSIDFSLGGPATITLNSEIAVFDELVIDGPGSGALTIAIGAGKAARHFNSAGANFAVRGCTLVDGDPGGAGDGEDGGSIRFEGGQGGETLTLDDVVFHNNRATSPGENSGCGGAVFIANGNLSADKCVFEENLATNSGGAICIRPNFTAASPLYNLGDCTFRMNSAGSRGGAIDMVEGSDPLGLLGPQLTLAFCFFIDNHVDGGGFADERGGGALRAEALADVNQRHLRLQIIGSQFESNSAQAGGAANGLDAVGGAVSLRGGDENAGGDDDIVQATVDGSTFAGNFAEIDGGAWHLIGTTPPGAKDETGVVFSNCTLHANVAGVVSPASVGTFGGALAATAADVRFDSSTVTANLGHGSSGIGKGVVGGIHVVGGDLALLNTVVADNIGNAGAADNADEARFDAAGGPSTFTSNGTNLVRGSTHGITLVAGDLTGADPLLGALAASAIIVGAAGDPAPLVVRTPQSGSPLIDAGSTPLTVDQIGSARPTGAAPEIGAVELAGGDPPSGGALIITEIMYDSASPEPDWEWVEIYNPGVSAVDLGGYVLDNGDTSQLTAANLLSGSVPPGAAVVVYNGTRISAVDFLAAWGAGVPLVAANAWHPLTNTGGRVGLWASLASYTGDHQLHANAVDSVAYGVLQNGFPNPAPGESIFLTDLGLDNSLPASWAVSDDATLPPTPLNDTYQSDANGSNSGTDFGSPYQGGPDKDWGDLPDQTVSADTDYATLGIDDGPRHVIIAELRLGDTIDADADGQASLGADADDLDGGADEDGVALPPLPLTNGETAVFTVIVTNKTGRFAYLSAFFDWNWDGDFGDAGESFEVEIADGLEGEAIELDIPVPANARTQTDLGARFRLSTTESLGALGAAPDGEVEDYIVNTAGIDWGDLPDLGPGEAPGDYQTLGANGGPSHVITPLLSLPNDTASPGDPSDDLDAEPDGQPTSNADGDNLAAVDDESQLFAVIVAQVIDPVAGTGHIDILVNTAATNLTGSDATLYAFFDIDGDGDFDDPSEMQTATVPTAGVETSTNFTFTIPLTQLRIGENSKYVRFRLSSAPGLGPNGAAPDGDVEDHRVDFTFDTGPGALDYGDLQDVALSTMASGATPYVTLEGAGEVHLQTSALTLGSYLADGEPDGQPSANADGDDQNSADDENGIALPASIVVGTTATFSANATNHSGVPAHVLAWVDWNGDGAFSAIETAAPVLVPDGSTGLAVNIPLAVPIDAVATGTNLGARFRISVDADLGPNGPAGIGEVEDYIVSVATDSDGDGLDDRFELQNFPDLDSADGTTDSDSDGSSDEEEEQAGSDPTDPGSTPAPVGPFELSGDLIVADAASTTLLRVRPSGAVQPLFDPNAVDIPGFTPVLGGTNFIVAPSMPSGINIGVGEINIGVGEAYFLAGSTGGELLAVLSDDGSVGGVVSMDEVAADTGLTSIAIIGMAFGSTGKIYALDGTSNTILRIDPVTGDSEIFTSRAALNGLPGVSNFTGGTGLLALPAGELALVDTDSNMLIKLAFDGTPSLLASSPLLTDLTPDSFMARLPDGDLLVVDRGPDEILRVAPTGTVSMFLSNGALRGVVGSVPDIHAIAVDGAGRPTLVNCDPAGSFSLFRFESDGLPGEELVGSAHMAAVIGVEPTLTGGATYAAGRLACGIPDITRVILRSGDPIPGLPGEFLEFGLRESTDLNNNGAIAFGAALVGTPGGEDQNRGIFLADASGAISKIVVEGEAVPNGGQFNSFLSLSPGIFGFGGRLIPGDVDLNDVGEVAFWADLQNTPSGANESILLWSDGKLHEIVREGDLIEATAPMGDLSTRLELNELGQVMYRGVVAVPGLGAIDVILSESRFGTGTALTNAGDFETLGTPDFNNLGQIAIDADVVPRSPLPFPLGLPGLGDSPIRMIRLAFGASLDSTSSVWLAREDHSSVRTGLDQLGRPALNDLGEVAFRARRFDPLVGTVILLHTGGIDREIARLNAVTPDGTHYFRDFSAPQLNNRSEVGFTASFNTVPGDVGPTGEGLYLGTPSAVVEVARSGQPTPGGAIFTSILDYELGDSGLAFVAAVDASALGMRSRELGLFVFAGGELVEIIQSGQDFRGDAVEALRLVGINDALQVAYVLAFRDYSLALCRTDLAQSLHYRRNTSSSWDVADNWTLGIAPREESVVCIDPPVGLEVFGPAENVTVHALTVNGSGSNPAALRLRSSGIVAARAGTRLGERGRVTGAGTLFGIVHGEEGSLIAPDGDMALGDPDRTGAFSTAGTIRVGAHQLSLDSRDPVQLFGLTEMQGGQLAAWSGVANSGTLRGDGIVGGTVFNSGDVRSATGERLMLWALDNTGAVDVFGGEFETVAPALNTREGEINCRNALLRFTSGLANEGLLAFSFGTSDVFGLLDNTGASRVIVSGNSNATFWDEVLIGGADFRVSSGATAVFLGDVSGPGSITGTGTSLFEALYSPGASPASVAIGGDITFSFSSTLLMELGGTTRGSEHDHLDIGGTLDLQGGTLRVELIDGFVPDIGDRFDLFDAASTVGSFGTIELPALASGQFWNASLLYSTGELVVSCVPDSFGRWQHAFFTAGELADAEISGFAADRDHDGLSNGLEYLLGSDPLAANSRRAGAAAIAGTPPRVRLTFTMPELPGSDLSVAVEASDSLQPGSWSTIATRVGTEPWTGPAGVSVSPIGRGKVEVTIDDTALISAAPRRFLRLRTWLTLP